jgi:hypothetical protein
MVLEEIRRLLVSKQDYIARLAADALDMAAIVQSTKNSRYKIIEDDDFVLFVVCRADGLYFWLHATGPDTTIEIRLFDQHHRECLIFENVQINYENQDFMIRLFALDVLNKTIILELKTRYKLLTRKIRFCHGYSE